MNSQQDKVQIIEEIAVKKAKPDDDLKDFFKEESEPTDQTYESHIDNMFKKELHLKKDMLHIMTTTIAIFIF